MNFEITNASLIHLPVSKKIEISTGLIREKSIQEGATTIDMEQKQIQKAALTNATKPQQAKAHDQLIQHVSNDPKTLIMHLLFPLVAKEGLGTKEKPSDPHSNTEIQEEFQKKAVMTLKKS